MCVCLWIYMQACVVQEGKTKNVPHQDAGFFSHYLSKEGSEILQVSERRRENKEMHSFLNTKEKKNPHHEDAGFFCSFRHCLSRFRRCEMRE